MNISVIRNKRDAMLFLSVKEPELEMLKAGNRIGSADAIERLTKEIEYCNEYLDNPSNPE